MLADSDLLSSLTGFSLIEPIKTRGIGRISKQQKNQNDKRYLHLYTLLSAQSLSRNHAKELHACGTQSQQFLDQEDLTQPYVIK